MTSDSNAGVSTRSLLVLGGLAALALNDQTRRALVGGTRRLVAGVGDTLEGRVRPALAQAASHAQELAQVAAQQAHVAAQQGSARLETLREEAPARAHTLLESARSAAGGLAHGAHDQAATLREGARHVGQEQSRQARAALKAARRAASQTVDRRVRPALAQVQGAGLGVLAEVQDRVQDLLGEGAGTVEGRRRQVERALARARHDAERELRAGRRAWKPRQLERAVERRVAGVKKQLGRELRVLEKQARRARRDDRSSGLGGGITALALLGTGAVVLARVPVARQGILDAVGRISPDAASALHSAGRNVRNIVGSVWMERIEEPDRAAAPAPASPTVAAASPAPGSPATTTAATGDQAPKPGPQAADKGSETNNSKN